MLWSAPGRVTLIGDHTDYAAGLALPVAIDRSTVVAGARRSDGRLVCRSAQVVDDDWTRYPEGVRRAGVRRGLLPADLGAELLVDSDVPVGAGLSSSAALTVAVAGVLLELAGVGVGVGAGSGADDDADRTDRLEVARLCQEAENVTVGAPTGLLDQIAVLFAEPGAAVLADFRDLSVRPVPLTLPGAELLVVDTRVRHAHADGAYGRRREAVERAAAELGLSSLREARPEQVAGLPEPLARRARHVLTENARVTEVVELLEEGRGDEIGPVLTASHASLRDDYEVSCPELDLAVASALDAGAAGARMTGGGFGGSIVALVPSGASAAVGIAVSAAFDRARYRPPEMRTMRPAVGARRLTWTADPASVPE